LAKKIAAMKNVIRYALLTALVFSVFTPLFTARAEPVDWINGTIIGEKEDNAPYSLHGDCTNQSTRLLNKYGAYVEQVICVFTGKSMRYAIDDGRLYVSMGSDTTMYGVYGSGYASRMPIVPSPATDDFIFSSAVTRDLPSHLSLVTTFSDKYYTQVEGSSSVITKDENGNDFFTMDASAVSRNGQWMVVAFRGVGLVRINLADMSAIRISEYTQGISFLAVSSDGKSIAEISSSTQWQPVVYSVENCGQAASSSQQSWYGAALSSKCPIRNLYSIINTILGTAGSSAEGKPSFNELGQLVIYAYPYGSNMTSKVTLRIQGEETQPRLEYLALGDSFSSGEGDLERSPLTQEKYYRAFTDESGFETVDGQAEKVRPEERCHVSTRSYPYLLASGMELGIGLDASPKSWQSVACSGATVWDLKEQGSSDYKGQNNGNSPRLEGYEVNELKTTALNEFIPGRQKQIEFVKKYQPKVITLTAGGNDIGFGPKINKCVQTISTCEHVSSSRFLQHSF